MSARPARGGGLTARDLAHGVLVAVHEGRRLDRELDAALARAGARDRGLLAELVRGTLQWQARYDHLISRFSRRPGQPEAPLAAVLQLGLHQLCGLDGVPAHAALNETAELCRRRVGARAVGYVNGLLQNVRRDVLGEEPPQGRAAREALLRPWFDDLKPGSAAWQAAWHSHPRWLVDRWRARHGAAACEALCAWNNEPVPVTLHVRRPHDVAQAREALAASGCVAAPHARVDRALVVGDGGDRASLAALLAAQPALIVQDATVQEATTWLAADAVAAAGADSRLVDLCAAPGGKTALLAGWWPGALLAADSARERVRLLDDTLKRIEAPAVGVVLADGTRPPLPDDAFDVVLLDGPCSGTGVLRHHPEGRWRLRAPHVTRSAERLGELAARAAGLLKPGGCLLYATCSLEPEEDEAVVAALLAGRADLEPWPDQEGRWQRLWLPHEAQGDGFFAARLKRR